MEAIEDYIAQHGSSCCRVATPHDAVNNSECCYSFHSPFSSEGGIVINLSTFAGTIDSMSMLYGPETALFVRIVKHRVAKAPTTTTSDDGTTNAPEAPTKLAIGVEGGFLVGGDSDEYDIVSTYSVVLMKQPSLSDNGDGPAAPTIVVELPYTDESKPSFPMMVQQSVDSIIHHVGVAVQQDVQAWQADDEETPVSKYCTDLPFVENGVMINPNPSTWKCAKTGATENLWLNLSDGYIGGGRKNWDGSGGSNGALDHYEETGKVYPLVVKLGTITADLDTADCYSYAPDEDCPVKIPNLDQLLIKRGIMVASMQKTVKSTAELEVELNANYAFDAITEAGAELEVVSGPGLIGLQNLGNSCYMNSIFQMLLSGTIPELAQRYGCKPSTPDAIVQHPFLRAVAPTSAPTDVLCQTSKVACALTSDVFAKPLTDDDTSKTTDPKYRLAPRMMKHCIGKDHVDFRTTQQQDAAQFLQCFLERLDRAELGASSKAKEQFPSDPVWTASRLFSFQTTERLECKADGKIKYKESAPETIWSLRIPMEKAKILEDVGSPEQKKLKPAEEALDSTEKKPVPTIALQACLDEWSNETIVDDIRWPHLGNAVHAATQTLRLTNYPRYLIVQIQRYALGPDWVPIKLEVNLEVPEELDLSNFKSKGPQEGEVLVPDEEATAENKASTPQPVIDEAALSQLMDMGFSLNSCKRALVAVGGHDVEAAMGWVFEHSMDADFNDPMPNDSEPGGNDADSTNVDESVVQSLVENLGAFTSDQVRAALKETGGAADRAADWLFSHMDDMDSAIAALKNKNAAPSANKGPTIPLEDGTDGNYSLQGMVSHIGKNTGSGHYVVHLKKGGKWVIFNDEKVAISSKPPFEHAYLYLYQRKDTIGLPSSNF